MCLRKILSDLCFDSCLVFLAGWRQNGPKWEIRKSPWKTFPTLVICFNNSNWQKNLLILESKTRGICDKNISFLLRLRLTLARRHGRTEQCPQCPQRHPANIISFKIENTTGPPYCKLTHCCNNTILSTRSSSC